MERALYKALDIDLRIGKLTKDFQLSEQFERTHDYYVQKHNDSRKHFNLEPNIEAKRKDQLLLNLQYNNLLLSHHVYEYKDYVNYTEEFFTYFLNYELTTGRCSPQFPQIIKNIFQILNTINKT